jgi:hypothetical protein
MASAQTTEELERARGQFQEALSLEVAGDFLSALTKLQQVAKVKLTPQVRYHLARCKEHLGRLTEALGDYRVAATEARELELSDLDEFERALVTLEARVPRLRLRLNGVSTTAYVELDGVRLGASVLGEPIPVDPGLRRIVLIESNVQVQTVNVEAVEGRSLEVQLQGRKSAPVVRRDVSMPVAAGPPAWAYVSAGVGTVAIASSIALFVVRNQAKSDLEKACPGNVCRNREDMRSTLDRGKFASWAAPTAMAFGALGIGVAVWGFLPTHRGNEKKGQTRLGGNVSLATSPDFTGVRISGGF